MPPDPLADALREAKTTNRPVVAILVPQSPTALAIAQGLAKLLASTDASVRQVFCEAVFVCLDTDETIRHFPKLKADGRALCLDASGQVLDECAYETELYGQKFAPSFRKLVHGTDGRRLRDAAQSQTNALTEPDREKLTRSLRELGAKEFRQRETAAKELLALGARTTAILALAHEEASDPEVRGRIGEVFSQMFAAAPADKPGPRLPFGFAAHGRWSRFYDACPGCGMGMIWPNSRSFLRALTGS